VSDIALGNETAIRALVRLLETTQDNNTRRSAAESLGKIAMGNETAIWALVRLLETAPDESTRRSVAYAPDEYTRRSVAYSYSLGPIDLDNETAIWALERLLETAPDESTRRSAAESLETIGMNSAETIRVVVRSLRRHLRTKEAYQLMVKCAETLDFIENKKETKLKSLSRGLFSRFYCKQPEMLTGQRIQPFFPNFQLSLLSYPKFFQTFHSRR
jgi:HEAT repeat protein